MSLRVKLFLSNVILLFFPGIIIFLLARNWLGIYDNDIQTNLLVLIFIGILAILIIISGLLSFFISESILNPLKKLRIAANEIKNDNLDFTIEYGTKDEFYDVMKEFDEMRQKLKLSLDENLKYEEEKRHLIASITHDLKTPITVIQGYIEGILDNVANTPEKQKKYLTTIYKKTEDINKLVDDLFMISKLELNKISFNLTKIEITEYLREIIKEIESDLLFENIKIELDLPFNATIKIDKLETFRVIQNLIQNSIKYKSSDDVMIKIETRDSGNNVLVIFEDNGIGIEKENEQKIFESFFREDSSRKHGEGSGLGLSIAKKIIEAENGRIWARSREKGLAIYMSFEKI
ncbi:MAG: HAMP domain-containing histidine kinase [Oscillospiraceae bacterium]|nr:HAMP domain-containing histidine kinase [Oscillospiraceae bacterium]